MSLKNKRGIALVALIITIVVLLILAVVTISAVQGNGIIFQAKKSSNKYSEAKDMEKLKLLVYEYKMDKEIGNTTGDVGAYLANKGMDVIYNITGADDCIVTMENGNSYKLTPEKVEPALGPGIYDANNNLIEEFEDGITTIEVGKYKERTDIVTVVIPKNVTIVGGSAFKGCTNIQSLLLPQGLLEIEGSAFNNCTNLKNIWASERLETLGVSPFIFCSNLETIKLPKGLLAMGPQTFYGCEKLKTVFLPNTLNSIPIGASGPFRCCYNLEFVILEDGFNTNLDLTYQGSTKYSTETLVNMLNALADRTGQTSNTLTIGATNLAKLTDEQKAIATAKNWILN